MKTSSIRVLGLLLVLSTQIFAQRFTVAVTDTFQTGFASSEKNHGYFPTYRQSAALGEKKSSYANIMLLAGRDTTIGYTDNNEVSTYNVVNSYGNVIGSIFPISSLNNFKSPSGQTVYDNTIGAVVVLDSLSDDKKTATVLFSTLRRLIIVQITINNANRISYNVLKNIDMPETIWQAEGSYSYSGSNRRLTLLGVSKNGTYKTYHLVTGNPFSKSGAYAQSGRVDFFSLNENSWLFSQSNDVGLVSGYKGLLFESKSAFGSDLVSVGDLDKNGYNDLAVLLPSSPQFPNSAVYIFFMENEWTPSSKPHVVITGNSMPWVENSEPKQDCKGLSSVNWGNGTVHLLVSCNTELRSASTVSKKALIKDLVLDSNGDVLSTSIIFEKEMLDKISYYIPSFSTNSNPLPLKNHKNDLHSILLLTNGPITFGTLPSAWIISLIDADYSKNYLLETGKSEIIVDLDSLFYKNGASEFSVKTLSGLVQCGIQDSKLLCGSAENAIGSWSAIELSNKSECYAYRECKRKDTIFVYVRSPEESANTALRVPKNMVIPFFKQVNLNNIKSLSYFKNPNLQNTGITWNTNGLKLSTAVGNASSGLTITSFLQKEDIDTLVFNLSISANTYGYPVYLHIADTSKILDSGIPANPGNDTIWNIAQKKYIALPSSNSNGNIYTYDIEQDSLETYAEIIGDYLHILKVDVADIVVAYTESGQIKHRKITLMPEPQTVPIVPIVAISQTQSMNVIHSGGGLQISGLSGEFELVAYNFKGVEIQREKANAKGSVFVKLRQDCPQIVQIKSGNNRINMKIVN